MLSLFVIVNFPRMIESISASSWTDQSFLSLGNYGFGLANHGDTLNMDGTTTSKLNVTYTAKSVITGMDSYFPPNLPDSLKALYVTPDSTHPNLAYWYTPDVFVRDGVVSGSTVDEWVNVANICYQGHYDIVSCTDQKIENAQACAVFVTV